MVQQRAMIYRTEPFSMTLNDPYSGFKVTLFLTLNISETVRDTCTQFQIFNGIGLLGTTHALLNSVVSNDLK